MSAAPLHRGFTLIELSICAGMAAIVMAMAWPSYQQHLTSARRSDATLSLERVQFAQARHHAIHGVYAPSLEALRTGSTSIEGLYQIGIEVGPGDRYVAWAQARSDRAQAGDTACSEIRVSVEQGFATLGPNRRCWNR